VEKKARRCTWMRSEKKPKKKGKYQLNVAEPFKSRLIAQIRKPLNFKSNLN
jgi:hypothetical protein